MHILPALLLAVPALRIQSGRVLLSVPPSERSADYLLVAQITAAPTGSEGAQWQTYSLNVRLQRESGTCTLQILGQPDAIRLALVSAAVCDIFRSSPVDSMSFPLGTTRIGGK